MKKMKLFASTAMMAMVATAGYFGYAAYESANMTDTERMMQANLEALTDNESNGVIECDGWFGWCSFTCPSCGASFEALGDKLINNHKCSQ